MQLLVIRHAIAADPAPEGDDASRPLTRKGIRRFRLCVRGMSRLDMRLGAVLHSPWTRAAATAELLRPLRDRDAPHLATSLLCQSPGPELLAQLAELGALPEAARLAAAVVGHEPFLGELIGLLTAGTASAGEGLELKKGSVTVLRGSAVAGGMTLCALLPPRALRELAR